MITTQIKRFEYKYIIPTRHLPQIQAFLSCFTHIDQSFVDRQSQSYKVHSIYFDTPNKQYYFEKIYGLEVRKKFRIRQYTTPTYGKSSPFVEIKHKHGAVIQKERRQINHLSSITELKNLPSPFGAIYLNDQLRPTALISYDRIPLSCNKNPHVRVTIDRNIKSCHPDNFTFTQTGRTILPHHAIIELKYHTYLPPWVNAFIQHFSLPQTSYSKYCQGLKHLYPTLTD